MNYSIYLTTQSSSLHKHKNYEIIAYLSGSGVFHTKENNIETCPGKIIIVPPDTLHHGTMKDEPYERISINGNFNQIFNISSPAVVSDNPRGDGITLAKLIYSNRYADKEYLSALINAFTHFLVQNIKTENDIFIAVREIVDKITDDFFNCNLNLNSLLKNSGYSEDYIRAEFKKITGKTPTEFLTQVRISHACFLIDTYGSSFSLSDVSEKCGFNDYVYFSRRFNAVVGVSPRKYLASALFA